MSNVIKYNNVISNSSIVEIKDILNLSLQTEVKAYSEENDTIDELGNTSNKIDEAKEEYNRIIESANEEYDRIITSAFEEAKKVKINTDTEYRNMIASANEEALAIIERANKEHDEIINKATEEKVNILSNITDDIREIVSSLVEHIIGVEIHQYKWVKALISKMIHKNNISGNVKVRIANETYGSLSEEDKNSLNNVVSNIEIIKDVSLLNSEICIESEDGNITYDITDGLSKVLEDIHSIHTFTYGGK